MLQKFTMYISPLLFVVLSLACSPSDVVPPPEALNYALTIKHTTTDSKSIKVEATFFCLSGEGAVVEAGVAVRPSGDSEWDFVKSQSISSPFSVIADSLQSQTEYELAAYVMSAEGERFMSPSRTVTTSEAIYDPTPHPDSVSWYELPDVDFAEDLQFVTHFTSIGGKEVRNFSLLYDYTYKVAHWVAYPLHDSYMGLSGRSEEWDFDPVIPKTYQMNMARSGFLDEMGYSSYDRGHQLPSADRTIDDETNAATFYYTNMTPQQSSFNRGMWSSLEEFVRYNVPPSDTLYVVTGCAMTTTDQPKPLFASHKTYGDRIAVPRAYFKVLVRSSTVGVRPNDTNAECIAFWLPNVSMTGTKLNASMAISVSELERLSGFEFFPELSDKTKQQLDTSDWKWKK